MSTEQMATTFRQAAGVIRTGGLTQGTFWGDGAHCTVGALIAATGATVWDMRIVRPEINYLVDLLGVVDEHFISNPDTVISWNDAPGRTAEDVITLLEQAAEKLEADL